MMHFVPKKKSCFITHKLLRPSCDAASAETDPPANDRDMDSDVDEDEGLVTTGISNVKAAIALGRRKTLRLPEADMDRS